MAPGTFMDRQFNLGVKELTDLGFSCSIYSTEVLVKISSLTLPPSFTLHFERNIKAQ